MVHAETYHEAVRPYFTLRTVGERQPVLLRCAKISVIFKAEKAFQGHLTIQDKAFKGL